MSTKPPVIMLVNAVHKPFDTRIFHKEAVSLVEHGRSVTIIIPHTRDEEKSGIKILAVPLPVKGWEQLIKCPWLIFRKALQQPRHSVFHLHDSELLLIGLLLKLTGRKVIYDAHEDTPLQISYQHWLPGWAKFFYKWFYYFLEKICGWFFNAILVAEPVIEKYYPKRKTFLLRNFPLFENFKSFNPQPYSNRDNIMSYVGLLSEVRGLREMLEGFRMAREKVSVQFKVGGKFAPPSLKEEIFDRYPAEFLGWVPYADMIALLGQSKLGIIIPHPVERYRTNYPVKLFECMAAGIPVIASRFGDSAKFIQEGNCGVLVDPLNPVEVADAIVWLLQHPAEAEAMGMRGRALIREKYNWELESKTLLEVYARLAPG